LILFNVVFDGQETEIEDVKGRIKYSTKVWYPDPRCFNDSAVDVKRICLYRKARYKIEKKNIYFF
jgi:hypothetical protein